MSSVRVYGLKNCDTCRKACRWLDAQGIEYQFTDYRAEPISPAVLQTWADRLGGQERLLNRRSAAWRQLSDAEKQAAGTAQWPALVEAHPTLVKRPVLEVGERVRVGFGAAAWAELLP